MFYVYVLLSERDSEFYVGYTADLKKRLNLHKSGKVQSTKNRRPLRLVYYEAFLCREDGLHRERYLKTAYGKRYLKRRLKEQLEEAT